MFKQNCFILLPKSPIASNKRMHTSCTCSGWPYTVLGPFFSLCAYWTILVQHHITAPYFLFFLKLLSYPYLTVIFLVNITCEVKALNIGKLACTWSIIFWSLNISSLELYFSSLWQAWFLFSSSRICPVYFVTLF